MSVVIKVEDLSKRYRLGNINRKMLYKDIRQRCAQLLGKGKPLPQPPDAVAEPVAETEEIWALRDVNFEISAGDVVGVIGRNGSGKSTLLKILSKITAPTTGRALIKGRVASLLEVGTGFHSELTGRENVYLNGSILGMTKPEIDGKLEEIVEFSGVEKFLDTPVKRYSSGMVMRLAFAVAANIESEILIIDEVLAVGDAAFQRKCLGKVNDVAKDGRTILFVSHQAAAVENLCTRGIVLQSGRAVFDGSQVQALGFYADSMGQFDGILRDRSDRKGAGGIRIVAVEIRTSKGERVNTVAAGQDIELFFHFEKSSATPWPDLKLYIWIKNQFDIPMFTHGNLYTGDSFGSAVPSSGAFVCKLPRLPLPAGSYRIDYAIRNQGHGSTVLDQMEAALSMHIEGGDYFGTGRLPAAHDGVCLVDGQWHLAADAAAELTKPAILSE